VHHDPVGLVRPYADPRDREVAALLAAGLAYGRVVQIHRSVSAALERLGPAPAQVVERSSAGELKRLFAGFTHRFQTGREVARLLAGTGEVLRRWGSLERTQRNRSALGAC
jgi:hypothetical protein